MVMDHLTIMGNITHEPFTTVMKKKVVIDSLIKEVDEKGPYDKPLAIAVESTPTFYPAEDYHQDYYKGTLSSLKNTNIIVTLSGRDAFMKILGC